MDLPPLVPALVALTRLVLGESLFALHVVPALAGAGWHSHCARLAHPGLLAAFLVRFGPKYGLPPAVSGHMSYHLWGPGQQSWDVMIFVTRAMDSFGRFYQDVEPKTVIQNDFAMPYNRISIYVCRGVTRSPATFWSQLKSY